MSEIEKRISELEQALIAHKIGWQESTERNNKLQAQVELLRTSLDDILEDMQLSMELSESDCDVWKGRIKDTLSGTPAQCLAEVEAQAGRDGFIDGAHLINTVAGTFSADEIESHANEYANQLRQASRVVSYEHTNSF